MNRRRIALIGIALIAALILAYPLRFLLAIFIFFPLQYLWWMLRQFYQSFPQQIFWIVTIILATLVGFNALYNVRMGAWRRREKDPLPRGKVEMVADWIDHGRGGVYFKWRIAHLLGEVHAEALGRREQSGHATRSGGVDPSPEVQAYLDAGLNTSFADYPIARAWPQTQTPFDVPIEPVLDYLEEKLEMRRDKR
jgi:hypothetical protein